MTDTPGSIRAVKSSDFFTEQQLKQLRSAQSYRRSKNPSEPALSDKGLLLRSSMYTAYEDANKLAWRKDIDDDLHVSGLSVAGRARQLYERALDTIDQALVLMDADERTRQTGDKNPNHGELELLTHEDIQFLTPYAHARQKVLLRNVARTY